MMWRTVFRLEWRILRRDRAALTVLGIFAAFLMASALAGGQIALSISQGLEHAQTSQHRQQESVRSSLVTKLASSGPLTAKDPRDPVWMGQEGASRLVVLPPGPLAPVAVGQRDLHPQAVRITTGVHLTSERETETPMSGPTRLMTGAFDPAFVFVVLFHVISACLRKCVKVALGLGNMFRDVVQCSRVLCCVVDL